MLHFRVPALLSVLVVVGGCSGPASDPSLTIEAAPTTLDYLRRTSSLRIVATNADGTIGQGQVTLSISPGEVDAATLDLDHYGVVRTTVSCPSTDPLCLEGSPLTVTANWTPKSGSPATAQSTLQVGKAPNVWTPASCPPEALLIYLFTASNELYTFHPPTKKMTLVSPIQCTSAGANPFSMAVSQSGVAWVSYGTGKLYPVNLRTGACNAAGAITLPPGWSLFGMGFAADSPTAITEKLYLGGTGSLGVVDVATRTFTTATGFNGAFTGGGPELSATPDGALMGLFPPQGSAPFALATIDKKTATTTLLQSFSQLTTLSNYAFALWGSDAWVFTGTTMTHFTPATGTIETLATPGGAMVVGAGVSRCGGQ